MKKTVLFAAAAFAASLAVGGANAACYTKGARAVSDTAASAKWYVLETIVQQVSWAAWPGYVATGKPTGYKVTKQRYKCFKKGSQVECRGVATLCKTK